MIKKKIIFQKLLKNKIESKCFSATNNQSLNIIMNVMNRHETSFKIKIRLNNNQHEEKTIYETIEFSSLLFILLYIILIVILF